MPQRLLRSVTSLLGMIGLTFVLTACPAETPDPEVKPTPEQPRPTPEQPQPTPATEEKPQPMPPSSDPAGCKLTIHVANAPFVFLKNLVGDRKPCELTLTGSLNFIDYSYLRSLPKGQLKKLDLSGLSDTDMPISALEGSHIPEVILPAGLVKVPFSCFEDSDIEKVTFGPKVEAIVTNAFKNCKQLQGPLLLPESVTKILLDAFKGCTKLSGDLFLPSKVAFPFGGGFRDCTGFSGKLIVGKDYEGASIYLPFAYDDAKGEKHFLNFTEVYFTDPQLRNVSGIFNWKNSTPLKGLEDVTVYVAPGMRSKALEAVWSSYVKAIIELPISQMPRR